MSFPDYSQSAEDLQSLLVLLRPVGSQLTGPHFLSVFNKVRRLTRVPLPPSTTRCLSIRYRRAYSSANCAWGDLQLHRRVLGLVGVARWTPDDSLRDIEHQYNDLKYQYSSSVVDSRLILIGLSPQSLGNNTEKVIGRIPSDLVIQSDYFASSQTDPLRADSSDDSESGDEVSDDDDDEEEEEEADSGKVEGRSTFYVDAFDGSTSNGFGHEPLSDITRSQLLCYETMEECLANIMQDLKSFYMSIFNVLDAKRLGVLALKQDVRRPVMLTVPFEKEEAISFDSDSRLYRKRCFGRIKKSLGDLYLVTGLTVEAVIQYQIALDMLRSTGDWLWAAAAMEGLCAASVIVHYQKVETAQRFPRNNSFSTQSTAMAHKTNSYALNAGALADGLGSGLDLAAPKMKYIIPPEEIIHRYCEVISYYEKFPEAVILEMEATFKGARVLILQSVVFFPYHQKQ